MVILEKEYIAGNTWFKICIISNSKIDISYYSQNTLNEHLSGDLFVVDFKINGVDKEIIYKEHFERKAKKIEI